MMEEKRKDIEFPVHGVEGSLVEDAIVDPYNPRDKPLAEDSEGSGWKVKIELRDNRGIDRGFPWRWELIDPEGEYVGSSLGISYDKCVEEAKEAKERALNGRATFSKLEEQAAKLPSVVEI